MVTIVGRGCGVGKMFLELLGRSTLEEMQGLLAEMGEQIRSQMARTFGLPSCSIPDATRLRYLGPASIELDGVYVGEVTFPNPPDPRVEILPIEYWFVGREISSAGNYTLGIDCEAVGFAAPAVPADSGRPFFCVERFTCHTPLSLLRHLENPQAGETATLGVAATPADRCFDAPRGMYEVETRLPGGAVQAHVVGVESVLIRGKSYRLVDCTMLTECDCCLVEPRGFGDFDAAEPAGEDEGDRLMRLIRSSAGGSVPHGET